MSLFCLPIKAKKIPKKIDPRADIVEIWIDHLVQQDEILVEHKHLAELDFSSIKKPLLLVSHAKPELYVEAIKHKPDYIDVDYRNRKYIPTRLGKTKLIISYHNYEKTPANLKEIYKKIRTLKPDIVKFSTKIVNANDIAKIFSLIPIAKKDRQKIITLGMGEKGKITRVLAPLLGNYLYYAPLAKKDATAPGQLTYKELMDCWQGKEAKRSSPLKK